VCLCFVLNGVTFRNDIESSVRDAAAMYCSGSDVILNTAVCVCVCVCLSVFGLGEVFMI
jgi:hypothetical protein